MRRSGLSLEVAEHVLKRHVEIHQNDLTPYAVVVSSGSVPARERTFIDMDGIRSEIQLRQQKMVVTNRAFRLQQWIASEAMIRDRWPDHHTPTVPRDLTSGLDVDGIPIFIFGRRRPAAG